ncbi:MAG: malonate decarboxylase holo-[acyl-carrier-protein] synthase [Betaproteobacteria bacterium]|nr:MAG: malonate decarboxylase holo-[acyl-carrier-protein] synthase [Betaproteobacteria bacterium]
MSATPLHRHQLAWLTPAGWDRIRQRAWDDVADACLAHWAEQLLPLVVTRQTACGAGPDAIAMGLPAPGRWERRRLVLGVPRADVLYFDEFPRAEQVVKLLPEPSRAEWRRLCAGLHACGAVARVHGSHGWQYLTGLDHVRSSSDVDVWIAVSDAGQADAVARQLHSFPCARPRLDGELVFDGGNAVAWREWLAWRAGGAKALLVKHLNGSSLSRQPSLRDAVSVAEAVP